MPANGHPGPRGLRDGPGIVPGSRSARALRGFTLMKQFGLAIRLVLFAAGLAAIAYLSLELRKKWEREAKQAAEPPPAVEPAN